MKQTLKHFVGLVLTLLAVLPMQAQEKNAAFYIYQNDGHFDGFFYDEVEKISYSRLDTLGVEHEDYVSQEIVTADSTYRIMLTAIDSVGFVQPEIKFNPRLHRMLHSGSDETRFSYHDESTDDRSVDVTFDKEDLTLTYDLMKRTPVTWPTAGDVFMYSGTEKLLYEDGWAVKVESVEDKNYWIVLHCKPIDDITDIFEQFVSVEEYGIRPDGSMAHRRVAGLPELTMEESRRKAEGTWEGDLFNFAIAGHVPLYSKDDLNITVDPSIEGKLHLKTAWNLSWFGDKYICIASTLEFGVGAGVTVDGTIDTFFPGGIGGLLGGVPVPAACPLFVLDITPDMFLRGDAHVKFNFKFPKLTGAMWAKMEINNWVPRMGIGFGNPDGQKKDYFDTSDFGASLELSGFVQAGMWFPMKYRTLPLLKSVFESEIGGNWFVGPKLAGSVTLDSGTLPTNSTATYNLLKKTKMQLHLLDADYEVKATVKTILQKEKKEVTLTDGSISLFPPLDAALVPEFEDIEMAMEERTVSKDYLLNELGSWSSSWERFEGVKVPCRTFRVKPKGYVVSPVAIGLKLFQVLEDGSEIPLGGSAYGSGGKSCNYYNIHQLFGQDVPEMMCPKFERLLTPELDMHFQNVSDFHDQEHVILSGGPKLRIRPVVSLLGMYGIPAEPFLDFHDTPEVTLSSDKLTASYDGTTESTMSMTTDGTPLSTHYISYSGGTLSLDKANFNKEFGKNYSLTNKMVGTATINSDFIYNVVTLRTRKPVTIEILPNTTEDPVISPRGEEFSSSVTRLGNGWRCSASWTDYETPNKYVKNTYSYDIEEIPSETDLQFTDFQFVSSDDQVLANFKDRYVRKNYTWTTTHYEPDDHGKVVLKETRETQFDDCKVSLDPRTGNFETASGTISLHFENAIK